jgi:8-oxo-dGTP pyrophosphatase MutT (NUDIX family)
MKLIEVLKEELLTPLPGRPAQHRMAPKGRLFPEDPIIKRNAAVIILINYHKNCEKEIIFIKRPEYNGHHSGQVSFPGGKEESVDSDLLDTSMRECFEEIGIKLTIANYVGKLTPLYIPISQFMVFPYVFFKDFSASYKMDKEEVSYIIQFPIKLLFDKNLIKETSLNIMGQVYPAPYYFINNEIVWGATAMILSEFIEILQRIEAKNPGII